MSNMKENMKEDTKILEEYLDENNRKFVSEKRLKFLEALENLIKAYKELEENSIHKSKIKEELDKIEEKYEDRTQNIEDILDEQHFYFNSKDYYEGELTGLQEVKIALIDLNRRLLKEEK